MRAALKYGLACVALLVMGCDQDYPGDDWDVAMDTLPEVASDTGYEAPPDLPPDPIVDPGTDPVVDPGVDPGVDTSGCTYPEGPYAYTGIDVIVGPAYWDTAIRAPGESYPSPTASFEDFYCDPEVESIVYILATRS
jgi:hypothetical protein